MTENIYPASLKPGDKVYLFAPAGKYSKDKLECAVSRYKQFGFEVLYDKAEQNNPEYYFAKSTEHAVAELHAAFANPEIKALIAIRGGFGSARLLPYLNWQLIKDNPKIVLGFSDITALLNAIYCKTGLVTYHGPNGGSELTALAEQDLYHSLINNTFLKQFTKHQAFSDKILVGGNLSVLASLLGSEYIYKNWKNKILFLEDTCEYLYRIDRLFLQLELAGVFKQIAGLVLGCFNQIKNQQEQWDLKRVVSQYTQKNNLIVLQDEHLGHVNTLRTRSIGQIFRLQAVIPSC